MPGFYKKFGLIGIVLIAAAVVIAFIFTHLPKQPNHKGTSAFASFDIVSAEVPVAAQADVIKSLSGSASDSIQPSDVQIRPGSYKKLYDANGTDYLLTFIVDITKVRSSFSVGVQYVNNSLLPVTVGCAEPQKTGYVCTLTPGSID